MVPPEGTHEPPYPTGNEDPRPWWHRELERDVEELKRTNQATELALLRQEVQSLKSVVKGQGNDIKRLTWTIGLGIPALGVIVTAITRLSGLA